ncbi:hypothetical protein M5D96_004679 [Drosophila gunungcola]|uniref:Uncharacterized protein n=1 Tax=Drosophila gunungcola TaxID=103775 RepID=A0A9P9YUW5_9MUSC|nr:hypothetical protein M5D96_004679 [Drosophila gunungcola]
MCSTSSSRQAGESPLGTTKNHRGKSNHRHHQWKPQAPGQKPALTYGNKEQDIAKKGGHAPHPRTKHISC